jgi:NADH-quinone oxidoreductase subunit N
MSTFTSSMMMAILPEILLLTLALLVVIFELIWKGEDGRNLGWLTAGGLLLILVVSAFIGKPAETSTVFGGMLRYDALGFIFKMLFIFGAMLTALFMMDSEKLGQRGESYILMLIATIGMNLMATSADLIMLYLAVETTSIPMYILAGFMRDDEKSTEAGLKYLLFGAMASTVMLYGFSLIFGFSGSTALEAITGFSMPIAVGVILLMAVGIGFKISLAPFHFWAPDVYEGAPTPVAGFLSTASKAAGFAVIMRLFIGLFPTGQYAEMWTLVLAILATLTMTIGNVVALRQTNIKRMLAYSSIAHAGYALVGAVSLSELGVGSVTFYLIAYVLTNLAAFGIIAAFSRVAGSDEITSYAGMSRRNPGLALAMLVAFLSLTGMPPFGGFVAKVFVFAAAVEAKMIWLAVVGVLNSIVGVYYYLTVLKVVYLHRMEGENEEAHPIPLTRPYAIALTLLSFAILAIGVIFGPWFNAASAAAKGLF